MREPLVIQAFVRRLYRGVTLLAAFIALAALGTALTTAGARTPTTGNGTARFADLGDLSNKLARAIMRVEGELPHANSIVESPGRELRALNDLEATKLRAVGQFPDVFGLPYSETFTKLSCIDEKIKVGRIAMLELEHGVLKGALASVNGERYASKLLLLSLESAKQCKDQLEVELLHTFDVTTAEQMEVGGNQTTPTGTDTTNPAGLNVPPPLEHAYATNGFIGRHEQDYVATGVDGGHPDNWPKGRNVLFFDVFDLLNSTTGAQNVEKASETNLESQGFAPVPDTSLGSGEKVFQLQPPGSPLLSTIIYVQRGPFILKIAGSCNGCTPGSVESSLETLAQAQLAQAVQNGFPAS